MTDRLRLFRKGMMASSLKELVQNGINDWLIDWLMMLAVGIYLVLISARDKFCIDPWMEVYLVLEEDGTEVDDEEYFQVSFWSGGELSYHHSVINSQPKGFSIKLELSKMQCKEKWKNCRPWRRTRCWCYCWRRTSGHQKAPPTCEQHTCEHPKCKHP